MSKEALLDFLEGTRHQIVSLLEKEIERLGVDDPSFKEAVLSYFRRPAKMMRPGVLLLSCGASGGDPQKALRVAAGVEAHHVFTLVHDDIMDRSEERRKGPSMHRLFASKAEEFGVREKEKSFFGQNMAILAGDVQGSFGIYLFLSAAEEDGVSFELISKLLTFFAQTILPRIVEGQVLDLRFEHRPLHQISREEIMRMVSFKTAELFRFSGLAGGSLGLGKWEPGLPSVSALSEFCFQVGLGFQIYDDLSDLMEEQEASDIKTGKRTLLSWYIYSQASPQDRKFFDSILGKAEAQDEEIKAVRKRFEELGVKEYAEKEVNSYIEEAKGRLSVLPDSSYKNLLYDWADFARSHQEA